MKTFLKTGLLFLSLLVGFPALSLAQNPTVINAGVVVHSTTTTQTATTLNDNVVGGHQLVAVDYCSTPSVTQIIADVNTGGTNQTWVNIVPNAAAGGAGAYSVWVVWNANVALTSDPVTVANSSSCTDGYLFVFEATGLTASAFDQGPSPVSGLSSGTVTTTGTVELVVGILTGGDGGTNAVAGSGYTLVGVNNQGGRNPAVEYQVVTTCGNQQATFTAATGTVQTSILTFKGTASAACGTSGATVVGKATLVGKASVI